MPVGRLTFQSRSAVSTSLMPIWRAAIACGSICTWTAYFCAPSTCTCATPRDHRNALRDPGFGVLVERPQRQRRRGEREIEDRLIGRIDLGEGGRRGHALRQQARGLRDGRLHVHGGAVEVAAEVELQRDLGDAERVRSRSSSSSPAIIENLFSSGVATAAAIVSGLAPGRLAVTSRVGQIHVGQVADRQLAVGDRAEQGDRRHQQAGGDGPLDEGLRKCSSG